MDDLEITKLCAEAMGVPLMPHEDGDERCFVRKEGSPHACYPTVVYWPLHDDAQAMALVKKFDMSIERDHVREDEDTLYVWRASAFSEETKKAVWADNLNLNRAICECVAKLHQRKAGG